jgi:predicted RNase H-like nuclease (RuvC/YqgF family)
MKKYFKSKKTWGIVGAIIVVCITYNIGQSGAQVTLDKEKVKYNEITSKIKGVEIKLDNAKYDLKETKSELVAEQSKLDEKKDKVAEVSALIDKSDKIKSELSEATVNLDNYNKQINSKKAELEKLTNGIKIKKEQPKVLSAGQYIVGKDIPEGRYKATNVGQGSNFFVFDADGNTVVNAILGGGIVGDGDYVFFSLDGYLIETHAKVKLIPVE